MVPFVEALLQDIQIIVLFPEAIGLDEEHPEHPGQRRKVRTLFQAPQNGEATPGNFVLESATR
ncbi:hypothetical protein [Pseudomonas sp. BF-B-19]|uniref:hypothetical protein n=1 Tax=Pseudomonas sp. BF-B-19 TaxID=2832399 RepID=UPI001CC15B42|nr:hypothetical protein [Pseudomonas sp. BF-B-19]